MAALLHSLRRQTEAVCRHTNFVKGLQVITLFIRGVSLPKMQHPFQTIRVDFYLKQKGILPQPAAVIRKLLRQAAASVKQPLKTRIPVFTFCHKPSQLGREGICRPAPDKLITDLIPAILHPLVK